jgi:hypothetical protein
MKNSILLFCLVFTSLFGQSQVMRSEVYDFSVGDYFGLEHKASTSSLPLLVVRNEMFHIISKVLSVTSDSVTYIAERQTYIPALPNGSGGATAPSYSIDTISFLYKQLNSPFSPLISGHTFGNSLNVFYENPTNECYNPYDSLIPSPLCINNSGQAINFGMEPYFNDSDTCAFEPYVSSYIAYSHAGGPYGGMSCQGDPTVPQYYISLKYVDHNGIACGTFPCFFVGVEENKQIQLTLFPNPTRGRLSLQGLEQIVACEVFTAEGKNVTDNITWNGMEVDVTKLSSGSYILKVMDASNKIGVARFVK